MKRLLLLLAVLPQMLVLSLGSSVCIGAGGHIQIEATASECCADTELTSTAAPVAPGAPGQAPDDAGDCSSCTDLLIGVDTGVSRAPDERDSDTLGFAALPVEPSALRGRWQPVRVAQRAPEGNLEPSHLRQLRSVLLRC